MKKIAVNTIKTFLKERKAANITNVSFPVGDRSFDVEIKTSLTVAEKTTFINRLLSGCFDVAGNFRPEYVTPMLRATILQMCTNVPIMTLKNEQSEDGGSLMDIEAMNALYVAMDLDSLENGEYQAMMGELVHLCNLAIDWKKSCIISAGALDSSLRGLIETLNAKVESVDASNLMEFAGQLSEVTKGLDEGGILKGLLQLHESKKN